MALWDIAGKAAGLPVYKLLGGKIRDRVRVYNGGVRFPIANYSPEGLAEDVRKQKAAREGFTIIKEAISFHSEMPMKMPELFMEEPRYGFPHPNRGPLTTRGLKHMVACVEAMKSVLGDEVGLALDCGPGWMLADAIKFAKAVEPYNLMWIEDTLTGDYYPYTNADVFRELTASTSTPIHTGEQVYLRQNFKDLFEKKAIRVAGPDPADVGGIAELKWIGEYADLHGIMIAPHGIIDGLIGLAALVHAAAVLPQNYIAFEYPVAHPDWWYDIITGLPNPIVNDGFIEVWDKPGLGVDFNVDAARKYLSNGDEDFFD